MAFLVPAAVFPAPPTVAIAPGAREFAYGRDPLQRLDFYAAARGTRPPLVVFVHGGGWKRGDKGNATGDAKVLHFTGSGYAFASIDYRLVPDHRVEEQAQDVADALGYLVAHAGELGFDPRNIVLMGHSAGAHLAALVSTDPRYLRAAGLGLNAIRGTVLLDGAAYDIPAQMDEGVRFMQPTYREAFGEDPVRQRALSPSFQAGAPNVARFLVLHVDRDDGRRQSEELVRRLRAGGSDVTLHALPGSGLRGHMQINRELGEPGYPGTAIVDAWIGGVFSRR
ncbi:MAG: alpha/beta hydrolase [Pseudomonadota bacterium]